MSQRHYYRITGSGGSYVNKDLLGCSEEQSIRFNSLSEAETFLKNALYHISYCGSIMLNSNCFTIQEFVISVTPSRTVSTFEMMETFNRTVEYYRKFPELQLDTSFIKILTTIIQSSIWYGFVNLTPDTIDFICEDERCSQFRVDMPAAMRDNPDLFLRDGVFTQNKELRATLYMCSSDEHIKKYSFSSAK